MMKALILAAGFGTRLRPHTNRIPKPLFPIGDKKIIDLTIEALAKAGCTQAVVNTHHLHGQMEEHLTRNQFPMPITVRREMKILGTGGAIGNVRDLIGDAPFMVINSDVVTDIDLGAVYRYHQEHTCPVTMVLTNDPRFNSVEVDDDGFITGIHKPASPDNEHPRNWLTFTGIHVIDPSMIELIPNGGYCDIIDIYRRHMARGGKLKAVVPEAPYWKDIGTPEQYRDTTIDRMAAAAFEKAFSISPRSATSRQKLQGDGSDRSWYRLSSGPQTLIMADHGLGHGNSPSEITSFVAIGRHLHSHDVPVPRIIDYNYFSGLVFMEDLGEIHLQDHVTHLGETDREPVYRNVIDALVHMGHRGADGFEPFWSYQTPEYDETVILENECRYFIDAFLNGYLGMGMAYDELAGEFDHLARMIMGNAVPGFIHRDFQSRNIMIRRNRPCFIDFQGGRLGPIQYDLASLLIDPYVGLSDELRQRLRRYYLETLRRHQPVDEKKFENGYQYCSLSRNLQILGAFGYLSKTKGKNWFARYIPQACDSLNRRLHGIGDTQFNVLRQLSSEIRAAMKTSDNPP